MNLPIYLERNCIMNIPFDVSIYYEYNYIDTCSIWNTLCSELLFNKIKQKISNFFVSKFVIYECLYKKRRQENKMDKRLQIKFRSEKDRGYFIPHPIEISDLQQIEILRNRNKLGYGEISSIILAQKTKQAFTSDDRNARKLAEKAINPKKIQRTAHLIGWLYFQELINEKEMKLIFNDINNSRKFIKKQFLDNIIREVKINKRTQKILDT